MQPGPALLWTSTRRRRPGRDDVATLPVMAFVAFVAAFYAVAILLVLAVIVCWVPTSAQAQPGAGSGALNRLVDSTAVVGAVGSLPDVVAPRRRYAAPFKAGIDRSL
jgi:hypothetical protein